MHTTQRRPLGSLLDGPGGAWQSYRVGRHIAPDPREEGVWAGLHHRAGKILEFLLIQLLVAVSVKLGERSLRQSGGRVVG